MILSVVIVVHEEAGDFTELLPQIRSTLSSLQIAYENIHRSSVMPINRSRNNIQQNNCTLVTPSAPGYGDSVLAGIHQSNGDYIITMDARSNIPGCCT